MDDHCTAKLWFLEHGSVGHSSQVHWLWQIQGLVVDRVLLTSVISRDHYPWLCNGRITEHTEAAVHTTMCIPKQHRESATRAITRVEWHIGMIGNTHSSEVNARNLFSKWVGDQMCRVCYLWEGVWGNDYPSLDSGVVFSLEHQFNSDIC